MKRILAIILLVGLLIVGSVAAWALLPESRDSLSDRVSMLEEAFHILQPAGAGPFPVALLFHGCGGLVGAHGEKEIMSHYAKAAVEAGYVAIIVDSFGPRGIDFDAAIATVCSGIKLRGGMRAGDVLAAVAFAKTLPFAETSGFVLAGWSHGGWSVMEAMTMDLEKSWPAAMKQPSPKALDGLGGVYLTYPYCGFPASSYKREWFRKPPTSVVIAEMDTIAVLDKCAQALIKMDGDGVPLEVEIIRDATHAFDESDQTETSSFIYDQDGAKHALARFAGYLTDIKNHADFPNDQRMMVEFDEQGRPLRRQ